jgi:hypothetical protein
VLALAVTILSMFFWRATRPVEHPLARFVILVPPDSAGKEKGSVHVTFLLNFCDELRRRIPSDK